MAEKSLLHLCNLGSTNIGNGALILGAERVLDEDLADRIQWVREPWDDYTFDKLSFDRTFVDKVNQYDGLIVGGAVTINGRHYLPHAGMRYDLPLELWPEIKKPVVFYGISYRHWNGQEFHHADKLRAAVKYAVDAPNIFFGVRNDGTKAWLEQLTGTQSEQIVEVPDPGMYIPVLEKHIFPELDPSKLNVILSFNDEDREFRFASEDRRMEIIRSVAGAIEQFSQEEMLNIILVPHYFDDYQMMSDFISCIKPQLAHQCIVSTGLCKVGNTQKFYGRYCQADLVVSMRVHSMSPSIGLGVPVIPLTTQSRMTIYLENAGLTELGVDALEGDFSERLLIAMRHACREPNSIRNACRAAFERFRCQTRRVNMQVERILNS